MDKKDIEINLKEKIKQQDGNVTFFDNLVMDLAIKNKFGNSSQAIARFRELFKYLWDNKKNRFSSYSSRLEKKCPFSSNNSSLDQFTFGMSQGTYETIKWNNYDLYKTAFDMIIYMQLISEIKPEVIIEYGSGSGGSAMWLADLTKSMKLNTEIYSYDIKKPSFEYLGVSFEEIDLRDNFPNTKFHNKKILVIEDAHVNVENVLLKTDIFLKKGDYLVVEDSGIKVKEISSFLSKAKNLYKVDNFYVDFFGRNSSSARDSIFAVF